MIGKTEQENNKDIKSIEIDFIAKIGWPAQVLEVLAYNKE